MSYFNHAFSKRFLGTGPTRNLVSTGAPASVTNPYSDGGFIVTPGTSSTTLSDLPVGVSNLPKSGYFGFFDPNTYLAIDPTLTTYNCCPLVLASAALLTNDKIGPFHGGYRETNKSKVINPKYVQKAYKVTTCVPQQAVVSVGNTPQTAGPTVPENYQGGTTNATCCFTFLCGETYYLRVDIKGSPALRALNHNAYQTVDAYTGCCTGPTPTPVDSTLVFIQWAERILQNNYLKPFVLPVVFDQTGTPWYAPGTTVDPITLAPVLPAQWWTAYVSPGYIANACGGMRLFGAFVETKFGNCTFQVTDYFEKEPIKIYASMVDYTGDPCVFEGICVYNDCLGLQGMGFGEQVARDLILSESYLQNFFASNDFRVREITQGYDILNSVNRNALYTRYFLLHSVPRFNNPTGVFDNDRYMLEIIVPEANPLVPVGNPTLDAFLTNWLNSCANCVPFETQGCTYCVPVNN